MLRYLIELKCAPHADIDEAASSSLYSTVSRPFAKPKTCKSFIKVINSKAMKY